MGFQEVLHSIGNTLASLRTLRELLYDWRPDLLILVDYPDFNFRLAAHARKAGTRVFYYIPPQLWAWRAGRVDTMGRLVDAAALIFPFEKTFYEQRGYKRAYYVGHPFIDKFSGKSLSAEDRSAFLAKYGLDPSKPTVALFPGSRQAEIQRHLPVLLNGFRLLRRRYSNVQGILGIAPTIKESTFSSPLPAGAVPVAGEALSVLQSADAGALKSGTSNLQAAVCGLPFTMFYRAPKLSEWVARILATVDSFSIVNNIKNGTVREYLQRDASAENIAGELANLLFKQSARNEVIKNLADVRSLLSSFDQDEIFTGCKTASERAAKLALSLAVSNAKGVAPN
jgi:lipid-A-disaccharide synthase